MPLLELILMYHLIYTLVRDKSCGSTLFCEKPNENGGQLTWELLMHLCQVIVKLVNKITVDSNDIDYAKMEAFNHGGNK
jgi:hypothetical protein